MPGKFNVTGDGFPVRLYAKMSAVYLIGLPIVSGVTWLVVPEGTRTLTAIAGSAIAGLLALAINAGTIGRLVDAAKAYVQGDTSRRLPATSDTELDHLGHAFNDLADTHARCEVELKRTEALRKELIANVSHALRTPLASIQGYIETVLIKDREFTEEERRQHLDIILNNSRRMSTLIAELFELSKLETHETRPRPVPFSMTELLTDLVQKKRTSGDNRGIPIELQLDHGLPMVHADIGMIERSLHVLLDITVQSCKPDGHVRISLKEHAGNARVIIEADDSLIKPGELPHMFEQFYHGSESGTAGRNAVGLAIVKKIMDAHGEPIIVESVNGKGIRFSLALPLAPGGATVLAG